jgi:hypothetical protein
MTLSHLNIKEQSKKIDLDFINLNESAIFQVRSECDS